MASLHKTKIKQFLDDHPKTIDITTCITGCATTLAFAPFGVSLLAYPLLAWLFITWYYASLKRAVWRGYLFGVGFFSTGISWIYVSINTYGTASIWLSLLITIIFILFMAIFYGLKAFCCKFLLNHMCQLRIVLIFPSVWVIIEILRGWLLTGFPWLYIGYSQTNTLIDHYASIGGIYAVTLITVYISMIPLIWLVSNSLVRIAFMVISSILLLVGGYYLQNHLWTQPLKDSVQVTLIQGNYPQEKKWNETHFNEILQSYYHMTRQHLSPLVFWPENAIPAFKRQIPDYLHKIQKLGKKHHTAILTGLPIASKNGAKWYNGAMVLGYGHGQYLKKQLVPFGEYIPLAFLFEPLMQYFNIRMANFSPGKHDQKLLKMQQYEVALAICYETAFPNLIRQQTKHADFMALISDDAWFGHSIGPWQHLEIAQIRAIENGRYLMHTTNNGVTAIINPHGQVIEKAPQFTQTVITDRVKPVKGTTPWQRYGLLPLLMSLILFLLLATLYEKPSISLWQKKH